MGIKIGTSDIGNIYIGSSQVSKAYLGMVEIYSTGGGFDPDAAAFISAAGIIDSTEQNALNQLVLDMKTADVWDFVDVAYPLIGSSAESQKFNLMNPVDSDAAHRLTFAGGITHNYQGILGDGTTHEMITNYKPSVHTIGNNFFFLASTNTEKAGSQIGYDFANVDYGLIAGFTTNTLVYGNTGSGGWVTAAAPDAQRKGLTTMSYQSGATQVFKNGAALNTPVTKGINKDARNMMLGSAYYGSVVDFRCLNARYNFASIGTTLSTAKMIAYHNAILTFNATLGRS